MNIQLENFLHTIFSAYIPDPKWYPFIVIGVIILALFLVYFLFSYIRSFIAWIFGVSEVARLQKEQNELLKELIALSEEQNNLLYELYVENEKNNETAEADDFLKTTNTKEKSCDDVEMMISDEAEIDQEIEEEKIEKTQENPEKSYQGKKKKFFHKK